jgi:Fuseless
MLNKIKQLPQFQQFKAQHPSCNAIIIVLAIIMFWRGVWGLLDTYLFPGYPTLSHLVSAVIGVVILYINEFNIDNLKR